jgi:glutamine synthetase
MAKSKLEYIWLDGYQPTQSLRSKTKVVEDFSGKVEDAPIWCFDGSSTEQAPGGSSDCLLKPAYVCPDPGRLGDGYLVMCEVLDHEGAPHKSNGRSTIEDDDNDFWFGFEQEYCIWCEASWRRNLGFSLPHGASGREVRHVDQLGTQTSQG